MIAWDYLLDLKFEDELEYFCKSNHYPTHVQPTSARLQPKSNPNPTHPSKIKLVDLLLLLLSLGLYTHMGQRKF